MEYITTDIFHWTGRLERTEEERAEAKKRAHDLVEGFVENTPSLKKQRNAWREEQAEKLQAKADSQLAEA